MIDDWHGKYDVLEIVAERVRFAMQRNYSNAGGERHSGYQEEKDREFVSKPAEIRQRLRSSASVHDLNAIDIHENPVEVNAPAFQLRNLLER